MLWQEKEIVWLVVLGTIVFLIVAVFLLTYVNIYNRRKFLHKREKEDLELELGRQLTKARVETQEETLDIVSKELHDNIGQLLNSTKLLLGIAQRDPSTCNDTMMVAQETLGKAISELRALSKSLNKDWMQQFDLIDNLLNETLRINQSGRFHLEFKYPPSIPLNHEKQLVLFRVIQEAIQNAIKHAHASNEKIIITENDALLTVSIQDDGVGFNKEDISKTGIGILNMENRIRLLEGSIQWLSDDNGTNVLIEIPLHPEKSIA
ncbi:MAG: hypothetical protein DI598_03175 [Pseudopedobacter saltans]|uniref:histidine kinase n=1 Tax=Pseudopedobacter saltans TaxID=151895 RepID=A0A2W5FB12_9SPHI|nr:MAG: hypothetical protein DI598_03175 [Pseudopedobacter saltans]